MTVVVLSVAAWLAMLFGMIALLGASARESRLEERRVSAASESRRRAA